MNRPPKPEDLSIAVRAYAVASRGRGTKEDSGRGRWRFTRKRPGPSRYSLVFHTETFADAAQQLRVGAYQWREHDQIREAGLFYDPLSVMDSELHVLRRYAARNDLEVRTDREFVDEVLYGLAYDLNATVIGFNLPFDLSRLAIGHSSAKGMMRGGFTLKLSEDPDRPNVRIRHLTNRSALIDFRARRRQNTPRSMRKKRWKTPVRRGFFVDVRTAAGALLSGSHTLGALATLLRTRTDTLDIENEGGPITSQLLDRLTTTVRVTWECYEVLAERYRGYGLPQTLESAIYSEASVGKACFKEMGIEGWRKLQPDFPPEVLGIIMSTYFGGRSEVRIRRQVVRVLYCDFLSQFATVSVLMKLWPYVAGQGVEYEDATRETRALLRRIDLAALQDPEMWQELTVLVQVRPRVDLFPVRTKYRTVTEEGEIIEDGQYTIGLNYLSSDRPLWYTLADCIASKLLTGKAPHILKAIRFGPGRVQEGLRSIDILGNPESRIDPTTEDFYRRMVELRTGIKRHLREANGTGDQARAEALHAEQQAIKTTLSASSYGIFVELNVDAFDRLQPLTCYGQDGKPFPTAERNVEKPGPFFHPLLATLITGGSRLLLAISERLAEEEGIGWALCDTDSMALAAPPGVKRPEFLARAERVRSWFEALNPYSNPREPLFQIEDANYRLVKGRLTDELDELWCLTISAKRHCMFNLDARGRPVIRKASAHGLGHLLPPYDPDRAPRTIPAPVVPLEELEVERWEHDLWYRIVTAASGDHPERVSTADLPGFDGPAVARYAATAPSLLRWFKAYNQGRPYREQVRPFGLLLAYQADPSKATGDELPRVVSPFHQDRSMALGCAFDRETGRPMGSDELRTYRRALAQYHLNPERKFQHADFLDAGPTRRRHVRVDGVEHIGKEANRWEEQFFLGFDPELQVQYGKHPDDLKDLRVTVLKMCRPYGIRELSRTSGVSFGAVSDFVHGRTHTTEETMRRIRVAIPKLQAAHLEQEAPDNALLDRVRRWRREQGLRRVAEVAELDPGHLSRILAGLRPLTRRVRDRLVATLDD